MDSEKVLVKREKPTDCDFISLTISFGIGGCLVVRKLVGTTNVKLVHLVLGRKLLKATEVQTKGKVVLDVLYLKGIRIGKKKYYLVFGPVYWVETGDLFEGIFILH